MTCLHRDKGAIVVIAYNRPEELREVLSSIRRSRREYVNELVIVLQHGNMEVEKICNEVDWMNSRIVITYPDSPSLKKRINGNVYAGIKTAFENGQNKWIALIEDDIVVAQDFFTFVSSSMSKFSEEEKFFGVNGFSGISREFSLPSQFGKYRYGFGWGWAISRKTWGQLRNYWNGNEDFHWDGLIESIAKTGFVIMPLQSRIINIGFNERASHTTKTNGEVELQERKLLDSFVGVYDGDYYVERRIDLKWRSDCRVFLHSSNLVSSLVDGIYRLKKMCRIRPKSAMFQVKCLRKVNSLLELAIDRLYNLERKGSNSG